MYYNTELNKQIEFTHLFWTAVNLKAVRLCMLNVPERLVPCCRRDQQRMQWLCTWAEFIRMGFLIHCFKFDCWAKHNPRIQQEGPIASKGKSCHMPVLLGLGRASLGPCEKPDGARLTLQEYQNPGTDLVRWQKSKHHIGKPRQWKWSWTQWWCGKWKCQCKSKSENRGKGRQN